MANNPYVNKVIYGNDTVIDISDTDASPTDVRSGKKFYLGSGAPATGTAIGGITEEELRDTVGWTGKNLAKDILVSHNLSQYNDALFIECELEEDVSYILSFDSDSDSDKFYFNENLFVEDIHFTTVEGRNSYTVTTQSAISKSTVTQYTDDKGWRILKNDMTFLSIPTITNVMFRRASIVDDTYEPYHKSVEEVVEQIYKDNGVLGAKNLIQNKGTTQELNGITFTMNNDGSVTVNGTTTANAELDVNANISLKKGVYILTGVPYTGNNNHYIKLYEISGGTVHIDKACNGYSYPERIVEVTQDITGVHLKLGVGGGAGTVANNLLYQPMLRLASDTDSTYQPYAMTNKELTDKAYSITDTAETTIDDADYIPFYDNSASGKRKTLWSNIKAVLKTYFDTIYKPLPQEIVRTGVTASAGGTVRIPASGTDSRISTANTCIVKAICQQKSDGTSYKYKSVVVSSGYVTITMAEAISNVTIGVEVINY